MRIAGTHHGAAILKNLYVVDSRMCAEFLKLIGPTIDDGANVGRLHHGKSQMVFWRKAKYSAGSGFCFRDEQIVFGEAASFTGRQQGREVVVEDEDLFV